MKEDTKFFERAAKKAHKILALVEKAKEKQAAGKKTTVEQKRIKALFGIKQPLSEGDLIGFPFGGGIMYADGRYVRNHNSQADIRQKNGL